MGAGDSSRAASCAAIDFGGTVTDVVLRRPARADVLAAFPTVPRPGADDVMELLRVGGYTKMKLVALEGVPAAAVPGQPTEAPKP